MLKNLLLLSGFSTFVVVVIIGLNIFHNNTLSSLSEHTQQHITPIVSSFDSQTLNELKEREPISVSLTTKSSIISDDARPVTDTSTPTPSPSTNPTSTSSPSGTLSNQQL